MKYEKQNQRLSNSQKEANGQAWYKEQADRLDTEHSSLKTSDERVSEYQKLKVNYDLFNNKINIKEFESVCKPYGNDVGELPLKMTNRDIVSGKIQVMLGMEMKRAFNWKVIATNPAVTTRRETKEFDMIKNHVVDTIMLPIRQEVEKKYQAEIQGKELTPQEQQEIQQKVAEDVKSMTPPEVKKYMAREYQDPVEVMSNQLLEYLISKCEIKMKFNKMFKHALLSAKGVIYVGILNSEPEIWNVNSMNFNCDNSPDNNFVEDGEWATCEYTMTPSEIVKYFGDVLTQKEIDSIYRSYASYYFAEGEDLFNMPIIEDNNNKGIKVLHCVWKSLRKIGFLAYMDEQGEIQNTIVDEVYKINVEMGDIDLEWRWIPEVYETWKIKVSEKIYVNMRPVPGQFKDLDNLYYCKLPYYGALYDNLNSESTSLMDRLKIYQYYYNIIMYRIELLIASDKGKKMMMSINAVPESAGMDTNQWLSFFQNTPLVWYNASEEGGAYNDLNTIGKVVDLSMGSDIRKYIDLAEYIRQQAGKSVGITDQVEGQIGSDEAVRNTQQSLIQSSHILEGYFTIHNFVKKNVLQALIETSKVAYSASQTKIIDYVLDDMSRHTIEIDTGLLDNSTLGIFVSDSARADETRETIKQLTHAAMQNQKIELSDVVSVLNQTSVSEVEEVLKVAEQNRQEREESMQQQQMQQQSEQQELARKHELEMFERQKELVILKEEERRKTIIVQSSLIGASYNPDQDKDRDGVNDFVAIAKTQADIDIGKEKLSLEKEKLEHKKTNDSQRIALEKQKIAQQKAKMSLD